LFDGRKLIPDREEGDSDGPNPKNIKVNRLGATLRHSAPRKRRGRKKKLGWGSKGGR